jgi:osmotically-inducible protein OsmY
MKFFIFLLGLAIGGFAVHYYDQNRGELGETPIAAGAARENFSDRLSQWHLSSADIKADLAKTGQVVRENTRVAGEHLSDARIVTVIKAKFVLDKDLSALDIHVESQDGLVTLTGTVASAEAIGKAVVLALDTSGVHNVTAKLTTR